MGLFGFFKKKKKEETPEEDDSEEEKKEQGGGGGDVGALSAEISKITAKIQSFDEMRKSTSERFATINEQMGELRGQLMDTNKNLGTLEVKTTKAADLVESVHPDKLMIQVQKVDGKVEGLRGMIEAKEEMIKNIMDQIKKMRDQMALFKGVEQLLNLNEEVKGEIMNAKKIVAMVERHADRVENIFVEAQKSFEAFNKFSDLLESQKGDIKELGTKQDKTEVKLATFALKKDFDEKTGKIEKSQKAVQQLSDNINKSYSKLDDRFEQMKGELKGGFDRRMYKGELLSKAFEDVLKDNPLFAKGLDLGKYIEQRLKEDKDAPAEKPAAPPKEEKKEGEKKEGDEKKEGEKKEGDEKKEGEEGGDKKEGGAEKKEGEKKEGGEKFKKTYDDLVGDFVPVKTA